MEIFHARIAMDPGDLNMEEMDAEKIQELRKQIKDELDEGILTSLKIENSGCEIISEGGFIRRFCLALVNFYENNGGKNYFTTTVETTVKGKRKRYEITIRNLNGEKSPAETIAELKEKIANLERDK